MRYVEDIANLGMPDAEEAGGKGANMGDGGRRSPCPTGIRGAARLYLESMKAGGVADELNAAHREALLAALDTSRFDGMCAKMRALVPRPAYPTTSASASSPPTGRWARIAMWPCDLRRQVRTAPTPPSPA